MRLICKIFRPAPAVILAAAVAALCTRAQGQIHTSPAPGTVPQQTVAVPAPAPGTLGPGQHVQFTPAGSPIAVSNLNAAVTSQGLNRLNPEPSGFKQVQEDLFRPLTEAIQPVDSMGGVTSLPLPVQQQTQPALDKHTLQLIEQRRNWAFTDLNDLYPEPNAEEMLGVKQYGDDGREKQTKSSVDKFYDKLGHKTERDSKNSYQWNDDKNVFGEKVSTSTNGLSGFGQNYAGSDLFQKNAFGPDRNQDDSGVNFSPLNGRPAAAVEDDKSSLLAQQTRMNNFEHLLDPSLPPSKPVDSLGGANLDQFLPQTVPAPDKIDGASAAPAQPFRSVINPNLGVEDPNAAFRSQVNVDPTAQALGLPPPVPAPVVTPPKTAQSIEDMLNPYAASVIKRKF